MQREEKARQTREKILKSAIEEFAMHGYEAASMNNVCEAGGVSKGIIYHYFQSKDDLYLACLRECFQALTAYMTDHVHDDGDAHKLLSGYFQARMDFFRTHEAFGRLFCGAVMLPPVSLKKEILEIREDFDKMNDAYLRDILKAGRLRKGLSEEAVIRAFRAFQDCLNAGEQDYAEAGTGLAQHEKDCQNLLEIFLFGIMEREDI
ncbi:MAG: TetR/AcrR family transcriptional regulator [Bilifractor sp.]